MQTKVFKLDELKDLKTSSISRKHNCSTEYVRLVLTGERERNSELAQKIIKDATDIINVLKRDTIVTYNKRHTLTNNTLIHKT